jgi:hypothetical protein
MLPPHRRRWSAVNGLITLDAVTSSALGFWTGEVAVAPRCVAFLPTIKGTGLPVGGPAVPMVERTRPSFVGTSVYALGADVMGTDPVQGTAVRIPATAVQGDPPRRTPPRC